MFMRFIQAIWGRAPDPIAGEAERLQGKLATAARGRFFRGLEGAVDSEAIGIFEQELREADAAVKAATREVAGLMARELADSRALASAEARLAEYEAYVQKALAAGDEKLAERTAERVANHEADRDRLREAISSTRIEIDELRSDIGEAERKLAEMRRELAAVRSRDALVRTRGTIGGQTGDAGAWLGEAEETLARIRALQGDRADLRAARRKLAEDKAGGTLDAELERAGVKAASPYTARAVLERLRAAMPQGPADSAPQPGAA